MTLSPRVLLMPRMLMISGLLLVSGCTQQVSQLTVEGKALRSLPDPDAVYGCFPTGEIQTVALVGPENSYRQALIKARNRVAEQGASHLTIDNAETRPIATTIKARGFHCPYLKMKTSPAPGNRKSWIVVE